MHGTINTKKNCVHLFVKITEMDSRIIFIFFHLECFKDDEFQEILFRCNLFQIGQSNMNQLHPSLLHHLFNNKDLKYTTNRGFISTEREPSVFLNGRKY